MKRKILFLFLIVFTGLGRLVDAQIRYGLPPYKTFIYEEGDLGVQTLAINQLGDGRIIVGTSNGILMYDGSSITSILKGYIVRSLFLDTVRGKERIYFGGENDFGYLEKNSFGKYEKVILSDNLPEDYKDFIVTLGIQRKDNATYISCLKRFFIYKNDTLYRSFEPEDEGMFFYLYKLYNRYFFYDNNKGIVEVKNDSLYELPNTNIFIEKGADYIFSAGSDKLYVCSLKPTQIYIYDLKEGTVEEFHTPLDKYFSKNGINVIKKLKDGNFAIGTMRGGLIVANNDFSPVFIMNSTNSLENDFITDILVDSQDNIWFYSNNGFGVIYYPNKIFELDNKKIGIKDIPTNMEVINQKLYISTYDNFLSLNLDTTLLSSNDYWGIDKNYKKILIGKQVMDFLSVGHNEIVATGDFGAYDIRDGQINPISSSFFGVNLLLSRYDSSIIYISTIDGFVVLKKQQDAYHQINQIKFNSFASFIYETAPGQVYLALQSDILKKINFDSTFTKYSVKDITFDSYNIKSLPDLFLLDDTLFLFKKTKRGVKVLYLNDKDDSLYEWHYDVKFEANSDTTLLPGYFDNSILKKDTTYTLLSKKGFIRVKIKGNTIFITNKDFKGSDINVLFSFCEDERNNLIWAVSNKKIYNLPVNYHHEAKSFSCLISSVSTVGDSLIAENNVNPKTVLDYSFNTLIFNFAAPYFERSDEIRYSYFLDGFDKIWSEWDGRNFTQYTNLPPGDYTFRVKAKNVYGEESSEAIFRFTVLPPWYLTWWAYVLYVLTGVVFIIIIVRLYSYRLKRANERLEKIVRERNKELYHKNELITHSIEYAKKIQDAILPVEGELKKVFADAFVFFRPKDIVSGDFYWFYKINKDEVIVALSDCTGHGVPGAFMSMIGISLLNEIVMDKKIYEPGKILLELHRQVKKSLQSKKDLTDTFDGMDIAVLRINFKEKQILLSSANQYIFVVKENDVDTYLGDIYSIGDPLAREEIKFNTESIEFDDKTIVYLTSDGFLDQFGGESGSKYSVRRFVELLKRIKYKDFDKQREEVTKEFEEWKGEKQQLDDILVVGFKLIK